LEGRELEAFGFRERPFREDEVLEWVAARGHAKEEFAFRGEVESEGIAADGADLFDGRAIRAEADDAIGEAGEGFLFAGSGGLEAGAAAGVDPAIRGCGEVIENEVIREGDIAEERDGGVRLAIAVRVADP
jgi:hypothetical protein